RNVAGGEAGDRLAEHHGEVDGRRVGGVGLAGRLVDRHRGRRRVGNPRDRVVGRRGGGAGVAGGVGGGAGRDGRHHRARRGHARDGHGVGGAGPRDGRRQGAAGGGAGEGHVGAGEAGDRLAEHHGEADGRRAGRVRLAGGLVDGHRGRDVVPRDRVVGRRGGGAGVAGGVGGGAGRDGGHHRARRGHARHRDGVGGAGPRDRRRQ